MKRIGILSDTHGTFDEPLREFFKDVDELWHAGDFADPATADAIAAFKPLRAVRGNADGGSLRLTYPEFTVFQCERVNVLMAHIGGFQGRYTPQVQELIAKLHPQVFVCGHSHILKIKFDKKSDLLYINPGAAGCHGFHRVRTAVRCIADAGALHDMEVGEWSRAGHE